MEFACAEFLQGKCIGIDDLVDAKCRDGTLILADYYTLLETISILRRYADKTAAQSFLQKLVRSPPNSLDDYHETFRHNREKHEAYASEIMASQVKRVGVKREVKCAICGADNWFITEKQVARADEPTKVFPQCLDCHPV